MGLLRGDELVADYLARLGTAAAELPAPDRTWLLESTRRRIRERAGGPGTRDEALVEVVLRELGEPATVVEAARTGQAHRTDIEHRRPEAPASPSTGDEAGALRRSAPIRAGDVVQAESAPAPAEVAMPAAAPSENEHEFVDEDADADEDGRADDPTAPFPPLLTDTDPHLVLPASLGSVRPAPVHVDAGPDRLTAFTGVKLELGALVVLAVGPSVLGLAGFALAFVLVAVSRFWAVRDKVAVTLGFTAAGLLLAVIGAWLSATQLQESDDPGTRISTAGHSLAHSLHALPAAICWVAALYLGYVLVRDLNEHGRR